MRIDARFPLRVKKEIISFVNSNTNFSVMLVYMILRVVFSPLNFISHKSGRSIVTSLFPFSYFKLNSVIFYCRRGTYDFFIVRPNYEPLTTNLILKLVKRFKSGLFIDIGSHIGKYTVLVANANKKIKVISIEANPLIYKSLIRNIKLNKLSKTVIPINMALGDSEKLVQFYSDDNGGGSTILPKHKQNYFRKTLIRETTLDSLLENLKLSFTKVKFLKIDVEGAEYLVIKGAKKTLKKSRPLIILEVLSERKLKKVSNLLSKLGYKTFLRIEKDNYIFFDSAMLPKEVRKEILKLGELK